MCPLYPLHYLLGYSLFLWVIWMLSGACVVNAIESSDLMNHMKLAFNGTPVTKIEVTEREVKEYEFHMYHSKPSSVKEVFIKEIADDGLQHLETAQKATLDVSSDLLDDNTMSLKGKFNVSGYLLGFSKLQLIPNNGTDADSLQIPSIAVDVHRGRKILEIIFVHIVVILILLAYINMGCALDLNVVKATLRRPVGPFIGLAAQYIIMPLVSFSLGYALFRDTPEMWLGLFLTGCAPGGGGSNLWTYLLNGSLDLSVTMTFVSTAAAFFMLPLWVFALGRVIFTGAKFNRFPYRNLVVLLVGLFVACGIGVVIRHFRPRVADFLKKMLKPIAIVFIIFVMTFGVYANLYMFSFFSWKVIVGGFCLPFFGYLFGGLTAIAMRQEWPNVTAISIETGIQNTGLAIGVIKIALKDFSPLDDISMVMPVAVATMTPIPLAISYLLQIFKNRQAKRYKDVQALEVNGQYA